VGGAFVAAGYQDRQPIVGRRAHLVGKDAGVDRTRLGHLFTRREVLFDAVDAHRARIVERHQNVLRRDVRADVDRARRQPYRGSVRAESASRGIDAERGDVVLGPGPAITGSATAGRDI